MEVPSSIQVPRAIHRGERDLPFIDVGDGTELQLLQVEESSRMRSNIGFAEVTGKPEVNLFFSTDVPDTDLFVTLSDVHPDGKSILITEGAVRTRFRESLEKPSLLTPNQVYEIKIPLWETSNVFKKGHRIRVHITSSNFPRFNRNLNSGKAPADEAEADIRIATQTIYHGGRRASSIVLPVIP